MWERRTGLLDLGALLVTIRDVLFDPATTFRTMVREGGVAAPLLFLLVTSAVFVTIGDLWKWLGNLFSGDASLEMIEALGGSLPPDLMDMFRTALEAQQDASLLGFVAGVFFKLALLFVGLLVWSGVVHLLLMVVDGARQSFETTLRVLAYCTGSAMAFLVIPLCGGVIGFVWLVVVQIVGLGQAHETTPGKSVFAVLFPAVLCGASCCVAGVFVAIMIAGRGF